MTTADKLTAIAENQEAVYEAGKSNAYDNPKTPTDNRTCLSYWTTYLNGEYGYRWDSYMEYNKETTDFDFVFPIYDKSLALDSLEYPKGTSGVSNFDKAFTMWAWNEEFISDDLFPAPVKKFVGTLDMSNALFTKEVFGSKYYNFIEDAGTIIFPESDTCDLSFVTNLVSLKYIKAEGNINNSVDFRKAPLMRESIISVINALSSSAAGKTATFNEAAKEAAFTDEEWTELIATKPNWKISLAT